MNMNKKRISVQVPEYFLIDIKRMALERNITMRKYVMGALLKQITKDKELLGEVGEACIKKNVNEVISASTSKAI
jgi:hypothetical protein